MMSFLANWVWADILQGMDKLIAVNYMIHESFVSNEFLIYYLEFLASFECLF